MKQIMLGFHAIQARCALTLIASKQSILIQPGAIAAWVIF
jgi:hypothetical protein